MHANEATLRKPQRMGAGRQESQPDIQGARPPRRGEGLEAELITHGQWPHQSRLHKEGSTKIQKDEGSESFHIGESPDTGVPGGVTHPDKAQKLCIPFPHTSPRASRPFGCPKLYSLIIHWKSRK